MIYNDLKDLFRAYGLNLDNEPENDNRTKYLGAYLGIRIHIIRLIIGITYEVIKILEENHQVIESAFFQSIIKQLSKDSKKSWQLLIDVMNDIDKNDPRRKFLIKCRNKIAFHYDIEQIYRGYRYHFYREDGTKDRAYISRGGGLPESRCYFADAAANGYLNIHLESESESNLFDESIAILKPLSNVLLELVERFIQKRNFPFRKYNNPE